MGLDVTAYRRLTKLDCVFDADGEPINAITREPIDRYNQFYVNSDFPGRADDIESQGIYTSEGALDGWSGGYGRYNRWRDKLAEVAGWPLGKYERHGMTLDSHCVSCWEGAEGPFSELICFSDCEGVIGAAISAKLAKDFADFDEKAKAVTDFDGFYERYQEWRAVFEFAADGGAVKFH